MIINVDKLNRIKEISPEKKSAKRDLNLWYFYISLKLAVQKCQEEISWRGKKVISTVKKEKKVSQKRFFVCERHTETAINSFHYLWMEEEAP